MASGIARIEIREIPETHSSGGDGRWEAYRTDDEPAEVVFYCPSCAEREFERD